MYKVNDAVVYGSYGVCVITAVEKRDFTGKDVEYFILRPVGDERNTFYVPTDSENKLRSVCTREEVEQLISGMPEQPSDWIEDDFKRKDEYRKTLESGDRYGLIKMIKAIYNRRLWLAQNHKKLRSVDERFLNDAESMLYDEFAYALNIPRDKVMGYIKEKLA